MIEVLCAGQLAADILVRPVDKLDFGDDTQRVEVIEIRNGGDSLNVTTCTVLVVINSTGERTFFYLGGANDQFALKDVNRSLLDKAAVVHVGGTYLLPQFDGDEAARLFREARSTGKLTSMDVTWDTQGRWRKTIETCFPCKPFAPRSWTPPEPATPSSPGFWPEYCAGGTCVNARALPARSRR